MIAYLRQFTNSALEGSGERSSVLVWSGLTTLAMIFCGCRSLLALVGSRAGMSFTHGLNACGFRRFSAGRRSQAATPRRGS
jgi:hypothetical protein